MKRFKMDERQPLSDSIRKYFAETPLKQSKVKALLKLQEERKGKTKNNSEMFLWVTSCASVLFLLVLAFQTYWYLREPGEYRPASVSFTDLVKQNLIKEVAMNYNKQLNPEVRYTTFEETKKHFGKLDFNPINPAIVKENGNWELLGARYENFNGSLSILYLYYCGDTRSRVYLLQTNQPDGFTEINTPIKVNKDGVSIGMWTEKGLLVGMARGY